MSRDSSNSISGLDVPQQKLPSSSSSSAAAAQAAAGRSSLHRLRQSPEGREREFPATRVGTAAIAGGPGDNTSSDQLLGSAAGAGAGGGAGGMGAGDERYYHPVAPSSLRCAGGQLGQSRDFHYSLQEHSHGYRQPQQQQSRPQQARQEAGSTAYHSTGGSSRTRSGPREVGYYMDPGKGSPYHTSRSSGGGGGSRAVGLRGREQHENYLLLREAHRQHQAAAAQAAQAAVAAQADYLQHHSGSRQDLLDHDHNALYDLSAAFAPLPTPPQQYSFVRTCDGKFVRTTIPIQDFDSLLDGGGGGSYYRSTVNHTLRRPSKRQSAAAAAAAAAGGAAGGETAFACCPSQRDELMSGSGGARPMAMMSSAQSYATLRGRKQRNACAAAAAAAAAQGVGDNYGRNQFAYPMEDSRSLAASFTDDFLALPPRDKAFHAVSIGGGGQLVPRGSRAMSRSTDRSLDSVGLSDEELLLGGSDATGCNAGLLRASEEGLQQQQALLPREPPDGKEKPEPSKTSMHKMEMLSRKNSKCDLLDAISGRASASPAAAGAVGTGSQQQPSLPVSSSASECRSEAASMCGDTASVLSGSVSNNFGSQLGSSSMSKKRDSLTGLVIKDCFADGGGGGALGQQPMSDNEGDSGLGSSIPSNKEWKPSVPGSPHVNPSALAAQPPSAAASAFPQPAFSMMPAPKASPLVQVGPRGAEAGQQQQQASSRVSFGSINAASSAYVPQLQLPAATTAWHQTVRRFVIGGTARFFGVDAETESSSKAAWADRRRRLAIKKFGGVKDSEFPMDGSAYSSQYMDSGCGSRLRFDQHLTSELEGDKMVLKITKPPRNKDSLPSLTGQGLAWMINSLMTRKVPVHPIVSDHEQSRSYQPSTTGIAAYYQAEQAGGLAVCPPPLPRVNSSHLLMHGESPAEEVFFTKPSCDGDEIHGGKRIAYSSDQYRPSNWQRPLPSSAADMDLSAAHQQQQQHLPRMSSDVGACRIWNRLLDAAFDNSDRRKHGMGAVGRVVSRRRASRRAPESARKRKLGGNAADHRPFFTYWMTVAQVVVMAVSMATYGVGPVGVDLYKKAGMVLVTNLELEPVGHLEPANFWIGPSATSLIHLGAKYAPCMRWDEALDRDIREERLKERDTACCIRKDRAGCVQSPKAECSKVGEADQPGGSGGGHGHGGLQQQQQQGGATPRSNWWRPSEWYSKYPNENRRSSGPVCGLDPAYCEAPASVAPYIWPDDITKWPICRRKTDVENIDTATGHAAEHMICEIIGHPCCIGIRGQCKITTKEYCMFVGGSFHEEAALCSQVSCLDDVCGLLPFRNRDVPDQFYRTWTPLFLHAGVIHLAITVCLQYWLMRDLEKLAGAGRIAVIYVGSGMVGNLASAIFVPYRAEVGPSGAHFGLLACCMVEVIHQWPQLRYPEMAILKLVGVTAVLFLAGLLPWIDNYAHLFGFIFGFLLSYALMPFVTLGGEYERGRKVVLVWVCLAAVAMLFLGLLLLFYVTPIHDCEICKYFNCIPITKDFCADQNIDLRATELI